MANSDQARGSASQQCSRWWGYSACAGRGGAHSARRAGGIGGTGVGGRNGTPESWSPVREPRGCSRSRQPALRPEEQPAPAGSGEPCRSVRGFGHTASETGTPWCSSRRPRGGSRRSSTWRAPSCPPTRVIATVEVADSLHIRADFRLRPAEYALIGDADHMDVTLPNGEAITARITDVSVAAGDNIATPPCVPSLRTVRRGGVRCGHAGVDRDRASQPGLLSSLGDLVTGLLTPPGRS